jgi:hypothetical protein
MIDHQVGQPRLWVRTRDHPELLIATTYVCLPDTVDHAVGEGEVSAS